MEARNTHSESLLEEAAETKRKGEIVSPVMNPCGWRVDKVSKFTFISLSDIHFTGVNKYDKKEGIRIRYSPWEMVATGCNAHHCLPASPLREAGEGDDDRLDDFSIYQRPLPLELSNLLTPHSGRSFSLLREVVESTDKQSRRVVFASTPSEVVGKPRLAGCHSALVPGARMKSVLLIRVPDIYHALKSGWDPPSPDLTGHRFPPLSRGALLVVPCWGRGHPPPPYGFCLLLPKDQKREILNEREPQDCRSLTRRDSDSLELQEAKDESEIFPREGRLPLPPFRHVASLMQGLNRGRSSWAHGSVCPYRRKEAILPRTRSDCLYSLNWEKLSSSIVGLLYLDRRYNFIRKRDNNPPSRPIIPVATQARVEDLPPERVKTDFLERRCQQRYFLLAQP
ncbi:hypothetical protein DFP73DRAFT_595367 [Morchella snyderi]|nr:hypothetical protein DFP73DRAFT_595367 [Morchella snyderi]